MLTAAALTILSLCPSGHAPGPAEPHVAVAEAEPDLIKALAEWLKLYRRGKIDITSREEVGERSIGNKYGLLPKGLPGRMTARRELELLVELAVDAGDPEVAKLVLEIASVGLDDGKYTPAMAPHLVRDVAAGALAKLAAPAARACIVEIAGQAADARRSADVALAAAAIRALGGFGEELGREPAERALQVGAAPCRLAAAKALGVLGSPASLAAITGALTAEREPDVVGAVAATALAIVRKHRDALEPAAAERLGHAGIAALGQSSWRADMAVIDLLEELRLRDAVPALIGVLERFAANPADVRSGKLSGLLRFRAHEALIALTGAFHPIGAPDAWRAWWEKAGAEFRVAQEKVAPPDDEGRTTTGFFGIPVRGTRVVFVVDVSPSMTASMPIEVTDPKDLPDRLPTRLDVAKDEVRRAVGELEPDAFFNVILFSKAAQSWQKELVPATDANRKKLLRFLDKVKESPYTNIWAGVSTAMKINLTSLSLEDGGTIDEMFLLSDGAPTIGEVTDEEEILRVVTESNRFAKIRINTVFIASNPSSMDPDLDKKDSSMGPEELMKALAERNGGRFVKR